MEAVWKPAVARVHEEVADMQAVADKEGAKIKIEPWDYRYYAEKVRKAKYDLDQNEVKPYLQLEKLREGMFWVAGQLFGFQFTPVDGRARLPPGRARLRGHATRRASTSASGTSIPTRAPGKQSGAWMNAYRSQERFETDITTIVSNNSNFVKGKPGEPVLISWDDATTLFHEFGHALHGLSSNVTYPSLAGTAVARDYVEFPSQLLEHWLSTPEVLNKFALHYQTGKPMPAALVQKIEKASTFNQGFATVEYLASALVDMKLHLAGDQTIDPDEFERTRWPRSACRPRSSCATARRSSATSSRATATRRATTATSGRTRSPPTPARPSRRRAGAYDKAVAKRLRDDIFSIGNTVDPAEAYKKFRGREPGIAALMRKRGFPVPAGVNDRPVTDLDLARVSWAVPTSSRSSRRTPAIPVARVREVALHPMDDGVDPARHVVVLVFLRDQVGGLPVAGQGQRDGPAQLGGGRAPGVVLHGRDVIRRRD